MPRELQKGLSEEHVLKVLSKLRLITDDQRKDIFNKKRNIKRKLEQLRAVKQASTSSRARIINPINIVDVITAMELRRADDPSKPLDEETILESAKKTGRVIVVHEACKRGGIGGDIASMIMENAYDDLDGPVFRVCGLDTPIPYNLGLEKVCVPTVEDIAEAVIKIT